MGSREQRGGVGRSVRACLAPRGARAGRSALLAAVVLLALAGATAGGCSKENTVNAGAPACQPGELRCEDATVVACQGDGSGFEAQATCTGDTPFCAAGACVACETGSEYCSGSTVYGRCLDSAEDVVVRDCAALEQVCSGGRCRVPVCAAASVTCDENAVVTCAADGLSVTSRVSCGANKRCFDGRCEDWVCVPGTHCNAQGQVEVCSADGFTSIEVRTCDGGESCELGACRPVICEPNAASCKAGKRMRCSPNGTAEVEVACGSSQSCRNGDQCADWVCEPGAAYCEGAEPRVCSDDGLTFTAGAVCGAGDICVAGSCETLVCEAGVDYCDGNQPTRCADDGLSKSELGASCGGGTPYCEFGACHGVRQADYKGYARSPLPGAVGRWYDYTTNAAQGTVLDKVTRLLWQREPAPGLYGWAAAHAYCDALEQGGRSDWRLPTRMELLTLVDTRYQAPMVDITVFPNTTSDDFWTSSDRGLGVSMRWYVDFEDGRTSSHSLTSTFKVRCVAHSVAPPPIPEGGHYFEVIGATVFDHATGLEWQGGTSPGTQSHADSVTYCTSLEVDGKMGWRLPTRLELVSLVPLLTETSPRIEQSVFPDTPPESHWSASLVPNPTDAWSVDFTSGVLSTRGISETGRARCVR